MFRPKKKKGKKKKKKKHMSQVVLANRKERTRERERERKKSREIEREALGVVVKHKESKQIFSCTKEKGKNVRKKKLLQMKLLPRISTSAFILFYSILFYFIFGVQSRSAAAVFFFFLFF
jgi:hypothetical protein